jgi:hypothetical protein
VHDYVTGTVADVREPTGGRHGSSSEPEGYYDLVLKQQQQPSRKRTALRGEDSENNGRIIRAKRVVFALGAAGSPNIPAPFYNAHCPVCSGVSFESGCGADASSANPRVVVHTSRWRELLQALQSVGVADSVLVVGGGQSAAQAALLAARRGAGRVVLCSRRPLKQRQYDLPMEWMDRYALAGSKGARGARLFDFFGTPLHARLAWCRRERGGGATVPASYLRQLDRTPNLEHLVDEAATVSSLQQQQQQEKTLLPGNSSNGTTLFHRVTFASGAQPMNATLVVLATGSTVDCLELDPVS